LSACQICGKPPSPYPNWIIGDDLEAHVGCLADAFPILLDTLEAAPEPPDITGCEVARVPALVAQWYQFRYLPWLKTRAAALAKATP